VYVVGMEKLNATTDTPLWKQVIGLPLPIIISMGILYYFWNKNKNNEGIEINHDKVL